jgi:hypothetical protein
MARAAALSFTGTLAWLWVRRITRNSWASFAGSVLAIFGGGTRWFLRLSSFKLALAIGHGSQAAAKPAPKAKAEEVIRLMEFIEKKIYEEKGISLEREVKVVGEP